MALTESVTKEIIRKLIKNEAYGIEISNLLNADFMQYAIDFFKRVAIAKLENQTITEDCYKKELLHSELSKKELAIHSGTNEKTITNMFNSGRKEIVLDASIQHYEKLHSLITDLVSSNSEINLTLTIKLNGVSVDLDINESLIVISSLAAKRDALNGGLWSTAGKRVEKPLMLTLCHIFGVLPDYYQLQIKSKKAEKQQINLDEDTDFEREIDFYLKKEQNLYRCEVKLMSKGNPESADAVIARGSRVFVANKMSDTNKKQMNSLGVEWVELRNEEGYQRFEKVLQNLDIPYTPFSGDIDKKLTEIFALIF
jgi:hypothetical protein